MVVDQSMNGVIFLAYIEQFLASTLKAGDIFILGNLPAQKVDGVHEAVEARGAKLIYLSPYSPDLNPIELLIANFKAALRKAAKRTIPPLRKAIAAILEAFTPQECASHLRHCRNVSK